MQPEDFDNFLENEGDDDEGGESLFQSTMDGGRPISLNDILGSILRARGLQSGEMSVADVERLLLRAGGVYVTGPGAEDEDDDDDDYEDDIWDNGHYASSHLLGPHTEPQEAGIQLLHSGEFGRVSTKIKAQHGVHNIARILAHRGEYGRGKPTREDLESTLIPNSNGTTVVSYDSNIYSGQFSADSSFYYTCSQDFRLHVYDMTAPLLPRPSALTEPGYRSSYHWQHGHLTTLNVKKSIQGASGRWTITDANLSPDNQRMIYSSITPIVYMTNVLDSSTEQIPIDFSDRRRSISSWGWSGDHFGIWSCRFSADGNEVVAGGDGYIFVYDLLAERRSVKILGHDNDVNSCCWADTASGNVLISASDDSFLKVWDRRSLGTLQKPSGVLIGHTEGITYVSAKGDGRYILSNGKDQAMRLWDLRMMRTNNEYEAVKGRFYGTRFDYRTPPYPKPRYHAHPQDCSVMTYRGHYVLRTLIRCHFSPAETTGSQYLYSGSADGRIHIWSLDGRVVQVLDRGKTLPISFSPNDPDPAETSSRRPVCVRDVSWHSQEPLIMSAAWSNDGASGNSTVAMHQWKGLGRRYTKLEDAVEAQPYSPHFSPMRRANRHLHIPGAFEGLDSDDDEDDSDYEDAE